MLNATRVFSLLSIIGFVLALGACEEGLQTTADPNPGEVVQATAPPSMPPLAAPAEAVPVVASPPPPQPAWVDAGPHMSLLEVLPLAEHHPARDGRFVVHEWGTFTSMQSSEGATLNGLHRTDEFLPAFVFGRQQMMAMQKSVELPPNGVTQKLETPVIYFYNNTPLQARVDVDFPQGIISEWYPDATSFEPALGFAQTIAGGRMTWDVALTNTPIAAHHVDPTDIWAPSRDVPEALNVSVTNALGEVEGDKFIFYRGLGRFEMPIRITSDPQGTLTISNTSEDTIPALFLLSVKEGGGVVELGPLGPRSSIQASSELVHDTLESYTEHAAQTLQKALVQDGLFPDEARAMVDTWRHSYFQTQGLRVLYVVPRPWTDALLPIRVTPQPDELVRTLVGRVEILLHQEEQDLLERFSTSQPQLNDLILDGHGRFVEPRLRRVREMLADNPEARAYVDQLIWTLL